MAGNLKQGLTPVIRHTHTPNLSRHSPSCVASSPQEAMVKPVVRSSRRCAQYVPHSNSQLVPRSARSKEGLWLGHFSILMMIVQSIIVDSAQQQLLQLLQLLLLPVTTDSAVRCVCSEAAVTAV